MSDVHETRHASHPASHPCTRELSGGFSARACLLWFSFLTNETFYFEWGSGWTTRISDPIVRRGVSIEGSKSWYEHQQKFPYANTELRYVDIGETTSYSWPVNQTTGRGSAYISSIQQFDKNDVVLVDGRWRVACAMAAYGSLRRNGTLLVHDFGVREHYRPILHAFDKVQEEDSLAVFKPIPGRGHAAMELLSRHISNPSR